MPLILSLLPLTHRELCIGFITTFSTPQDDGLSYKKAQFGSEKRQTARQTASLQQASWQTSPVNICRNSALFGNVALNIFNIAISASTSRVNGSLDNESFDTAMDESTR